MVSCVYLFAKVRARSFHTSRARWCDGHLGIPLPRFSINISPCSRWCSNRVLGTMPSWGRERRGLMSEEGLSPRGTRKSMDQIRRLSRLGVIYRPVRPRFIGGSTGVIYRAVPAPAPRRDAFRCWLALVITRRCAPHAKPIKGHHAVETASSDVQQQVDRGSLRTGAVRGMISAEAIGLTRRVSAVMVVCSCAAHLVPARRERLRSDTR